MTKTFLRIEREGRPAINTDGPSLLVKMIAPLGDINFWMLCHRATMDLQELSGIAFLLVDVWMYGFGFVFVQALDMSIPEIELNALRLLGE